jgi:hypothetical protein
MHTAHCSPLLDQGYAWHHTGGYYSTFIQLVTPHITPVGLHLSMMTMAQQRTLAAALAYRHNTMLSTSPASGCNRLTHAALDTPRTAHCS